MKYKVINQEGKKVKDLELKKEIFEIKPHEHAIHETVVAHLAALRAGTADTKSRGEVQGGGKKPYKQKGTGRARQGTIRAPHYVGGGVVFGPTPRSYAKKVNKKLKKLALRSALAKHAQAGSLILVDDLKITENKTKLMVNVLQNIGCQNLKALILNNEIIDPLYNSARNIETLGLLPAQMATVYDILNCKKLVLTLDALKYFEGVL